MSNSWEIIARTPAEQFIQTSRAQMKYWLGKIRHCVNQLSDEQVWWRPHEGNNAIGNILLHLVGNLTQWLIHGIPQKEDVRDRPGEFSQRKVIAKEVLLERLDETIGQADTVLASLLDDADAKLMEPRRIQGFDINVMAAIHDAVPHIGGHTQEIIWITRLLLGEKYAFFWKPATKEQGA